jgi:hypothetical protein
MLVLALAFVLGLVPGLGYAQPTGEFTPITDPDLRAGGAT